MKLHEGKAKTTRNAIELFEIFAASCLTPTHAYQFQIFNISNKKIECFEKKEEKLTNLCVCNKTSTVIGNSSDFFMLRYRLKVPNIRTHTHTQAKQSIFLVF
jgi:hypothetical protein